MTAADIQQAVRDAYGRADSFEDFLLRLDEQGVHPEIRLGKYMSRVSGMRFHGDDGYLTWSGTGLTGAHFETGPLAYRPVQHAGLVQALQRQGTRLGLTHDSERITLEGAGRPEAAPVRKDPPESSRPRIRHPEPAPAQPRTSPRVAAQVAEVNAMRPRIAYDLYKDLRTNGRDDWSPLADEELREAAVAAGAEERVLDALELMPARPRDGAYRWLCRGLEGDHVLCMTVAYRERFEVPVPCGLSEAAHDVMEQGPQTKEKRVPLGNAPP